MSGAAQADLRVTLEALLRGDPIGADEWRRIDPQALCEIADQHGVTPLVADALIGRPDVPADLVAPLRERLMRRLAIDLGHEDDLRRMLRRLDDAGVRNIVFKGTALAYAVYPRPDLRPRLDTDLLIAEADRDRVQAALLDLGYRPETAAPVGAVMHQRTYIGPAADRPAHVVDVHWRLANPEVFRDVLSFDEAWAAAEPLPALTSQARGLGRMHATLVAAVHRVAHHHGDDRLIWLYDLRLLADRLEAAEWDRCVALAADRRVAAICEVGLREARDRVGARVPSRVLADLSRAADSDEISAGYLTARRHARAVLDDVRAMPTWMARWRLMYAHAFPPRAYMREVYAPKSGVPLPILYLRRIVEGSRKWLVRP